MKEKLQKKNKKLIDVSSIKSIESASKETDLMFKATKNSIKKKLNLRPQPKKLPF